MSKIYNVDGLGKNIKYVRMNICHMTQEKFSEAVNLSVEQLKKIETNASLPSIASLFSIADYANIPLDLLCRDDIKASEIYTVITLMEELKEHDENYIHGICDIMTSLYTRLRNDKL